MAAIPLQVVEELLRSPGCDPLARTAQGLTALHLAAHRGHVCVSAHLARVPGAALLDAADLTQRTALHYAAARGHGGVVLELWARGCNVDPVDVSGSTGAHLQARPGLAATCQGMVSDYLVSSFASPLEMH